jgi:hypothetical protein
MSKVKIMTAAEVTPDIKAGWSKQYGEGKCGILRVEGKVAYLRPPTRTEMGAYSVAYRNNPVKANEMLLKQIMLAGDPEIIEDDKLFYAAANKLPEMVQAGEAELENF